MKKLSIVLVVAALAACGGDDATGVPTTDECENPVHFPENHGQPGHSHEIQVRCHGHH